MPISQVISQFLAVLEKGTSDSFAQDLYDCDCGGVGWGWSPPYALGKCAGA